VGARSSNTANILDTCLLPVPNCRGNAKKGREVLEKLRGTTEVDAEFADIVAAVEIARPITMRQVGAANR